MALKPGFFTRLFKCFQLKNIHNRDVKLFTTSAKTGEGLTEGFYWVADIILKRLADNDINPFK